jgi:hypothetical protein
MYTGTFEKAQTDQCVSCKVLAVPRLQQAPEWLQRLLLPVERRRPIDKTVSDDS